MWTMPEARGRLCRAPSTSQQWKLTASRQRRRWPTTPLSTARLEHGRAAGARHVVPDRTAAAGDGVRNAVRFAWRSRRRWRRGPTARGSRRGPARQERRAHRARPAAAGRRRALPARRPRRVRRAGRPRGWFGGFGGGAPNAGYPRGYSVTVSMDGKNLEQAGRGRQGRRPADGHHVHADAGKVRPASRRPATCEDAPNWTMHQPASLRGAGGAK